MGERGIVIMGRRAVAEGEEGQAAGKSMPLVPMILMMRQLVDLVLRRVERRALKLEKGGVDR